MRNTKNLKEYVKELNDLAADWADWAENKKDYWYKEYQTYDIWKKKAQEPTSPKIPNSPDVPKKNVKPILPTTNPSPQLEQEWWGKVLSGKFDFVIHAGATYRKFMNGDPSSLTNWEMGHCVRKVTYTRLDLAKTQPLFLHNFVMFALPNNYVAFHINDIEFIPTC